MLGKKQGVGLSKKKLTCICTGHFVIRKLVICIFIPPFISVFYKHSGLNILHTFPLAG